MNKDDVTQETELTKIINVFQQELNYYSDLLDLTKDKLNKIKGYQPPIENVEAGNKLSENVEPDTALDTIHYHLQRLSRLNKMLEDNLKHLSQIV